MARHRVEPGDIEHSELILAMLEATQEASAMLRNHVRNNLDGVTTGQKPRPELEDRPDYVTSADVDAQNIIVGKLKNKYPEMQIFAEEAGHDVEAENPEFGDRRMAIDPIDSTFNFKQATSFHACSVAVEEYRKTENKSAGEWVTIAGVVAQPVEDKFYFAEEGKGAFLVSTISKFDFVGNNVEAEMVTEQITVKPLAHDEHPLKDRTLHVCLSKRAQYIEAEVGQQLVDNYDRRVQRLIDVGALQTAQIGTDSSGALIGGTTHLDTAAGLSIAREAGAVIDTVNLQLKNEKGALFKETVHIVGADEKHLASLRGLMAVAIQNARKRSRTDGRNISPIGYQPQEPRPEFRRC